MSWNYRVVREVARDGGYYYTIRSVLYSPPDGSDSDPMGGYHGPDGVPTSWGSQPASPGGETYEEFVNDFALMEKALHKPILNEEELQYESERWRKLNERWRNVWWRKWLRWLRQS